MSSSDKEIELKIALSMTKGVNLSIFRRMEECGVTIEEFFRLDTPQLSRALQLNAGFGFQRDERDKALIQARKEVDFIHRHNIKGIFLTDEAYPRRLEDADDAPLMLYMLGEADLNSEKHLSVVGTRKVTPYGTGFCQSLIKDLGEYFPGITIISGLAFGTDAIAHQSALENNLPTIAITAHGLDTLYPAANRDLARNILRSGGALLTEYPSGTIPYRRNFLERNRIVAAMADAVVIIESEIKGGAMSTANHAFRYNRDILALPGRISDSASSGCNHLIRTQKANLISSAADLIEVVGWRPLGLRIEPRMRSLFPDLNPQQQMIHDLLKFEPDPLSIDTLHQRLNLPLPQLMEQLTEMEFEGIIIRLPGNKISLSI